MWHSLLRSIDRFSLQHFKYAINELQKIKTVDKHNRELVIDLLQSIVEIVTYGDRRDPLIFECFMEYQVLSEFVRILRISRNSRIEVPLLQYLSIMIQNLDSEQAIYYCFSNDYINNIISHKYDFDGGDLAQYFVSFLRAVSSKINRDTLCLLVRVNGNVVVSFPLYSEALKFAQHGEKMIQTAVRALTLSIYNVSDEMVYQHMTTPPLSEYFSDLVDGIKEQCSALDSLLDATGEKSAQQRRKELLLGTDRIIDDLYYIKDILGIGKRSLSRLVTENLLGILVFPLLLPLLRLSKRNDSNLSAVMSLYIISRQLQIVGGKSLTNSVAIVISYASTISSVNEAVEQNTSLGACQAYSFSQYLSKIRKLFCSPPDLEGAEETNENYWCVLLEKFVTSSQLFNLPEDISLYERDGGLLEIFQSNHIQLLGYVFLLLIMAENKDLHSSLVPVTGLNGKQSTVDSCRSVSETFDSISIRAQPQILNALLKILGSQPPFSVLMQWHTGWFLWKLLKFQGKGLDGHNFTIFISSYEHSCERIQKELDGCWFDYVPVTLKNEWSNCKAALEEPSQRKDPFFMVELAISEETNDGSTSFVAWRRMVDSVKVFVLHLHLMALISEENLLDKRLLDMMKSPNLNSGRSYSSDVSAASFGSEVSLGFGIPSRIAFSNAGIRDIYVIPVAKEIIGKLLLVEKHPFRTQRGVVIAIAPLAGLSPKIDENHPTWLHLRIREFDPNFDGGKARSSKVSNQPSDGRWTLGFPNAEACEAARLSMLEEMTKQRSYVESIVAPLLRKDHTRKFSDAQEEE